MANQFPEMKPETIGEVYHTRIQTKLMNPESAEAGKE
jgi:hypothetical protein